ncbi:hypothetical protein AZF37_02495 [endosymbiont 'TC1' of Trimyema compressum]|uniref:RICIN domain-containing protein n=1 Tax=endosymbiont 'TC1' of Trimyema compressum TaxID=243899 RepID=UPI0007F09CEC|nr:RICIN domain-containing protein [endosymbiont 'TC1' of Trimyema compressum]AMP20192.1 hypothetical protein AZF37_02495 [endosymbiont 'TC1' of Trimyema compressum]
MKPVSILPTVPHVAEVEDGKYKIQSSLSEKNLEIFGEGSLDNGGLLSQWANNGYNNQVFEVQNTTEGSYIISNESKKVLDISSYSSGSQVIQITKDTVASQKIKIIKNPSKNGVYSIISGGGLALDVQSPDNGSRIVLKNVTGLDYQDFKFLPTGDEPAYPTNVAVSSGIYELISKSNGQAVTSSFDVFNGAKMGFAASNKGSDQKFVIEQLSNKNFKITNFNSNRALMPLYHALVDGGPVVQWFNQDNNPYQEWSLSRNSDGSYSFKNMGSGKFLEASASPVRLYKMQEALILLRILL